MEVPKATDYFRILKEPKWQGALLWLAIISAAAGVFTSVSICVGNHIFLLVPGILAAVHFLKRGRWREIPNSAYALLGLCIIGIFSNLVNWETMHEPIRATLKLKYFIFGILGCLAFRNLNHWPRKWVELGFAVLMIAIIISVSYAVFGHLTGFDLKEWSQGDFFRRGGLTGTMRFGYGIGMLLPILIGIRFFFKNELRRKYLVLLNIAIAFAILGLILTETRGGLISMIAGTITLAFFMNESVRKKIFWVTAFLVFTILSINVAIEGGNLKKLQNGGYFRGLDEGTRFSIYQSALCAIKERPVTGWGFYQLGPNMRDIKLRHGVSNPDGPSSHAHNIFLEIGADFGVLGLMFLIGWIGFWISELITKGGLSLKLGLPFVVAMVVGGQFEYVLDANNSIMIFTIYGISTSSAMDT